MSLYPEVRALRTLVPSWANERMPLAISLHCPCLYGPGDEEIVLVGCPNQRIWAGAERFSHILEAAAGTSLPYSTLTNLPFGTGWNTGDPQRTFSGWLTEEVPALQAYLCLEIPYANAGGVAVTQTSARAFGRRLAVAIRQYLGQLPMRSQPAAERDDA
jgi:hypothetical protein